MNHVTRREESRRSDDRFTRRQAFGMKRAPNLKTLFEYARPARAMNRAVYAATAQKRRVGCVDHSVYGLACDVADLDTDAPAHE
jgi:hypothetical protein